MLSLQNFNVMHHVSQFWDPIETLSHVDITGRPVDRVYDSLVDLQDDGVFNTNPLIQLPPKKKALQTKVSEVGAALPLKFFNIASTYMFIH